jgi:hypothetical protein
MVFTANRFASLVAVAMTLTSVVVAQPPPCVRNYTVAAGDWCDKISAEQHVSTYVCFFPRSAFPSKLRANYVPSVD